MQHLREEYCKNIRSVEKSEPKSTLKKAPQPIGVLPYLLTNRVTMIVPGRIRNVGITRPMVFIERTRERTGENYCAWTCLARELVLCRVDAKLEPQRVDVICKRLDST